MPMKFEIADEPGHMSIESVTWHGSIKGVDDSFFYAEVCDVGDPDGEPLEIEVPLGDVQEADVCMVKLGAIFVCQQVVVWRGDIGFLVKRKVSFAKYPRMDGWSVDDPSEIADGFFEEEEGT